MPWPIRGAARSCVSCATSSAPRAKSPRTSPRSPGRLSRSTCASYARRASSPKGAPALAACTARDRGAFVEVVPPSRVVFTFGWDNDEVVPPGSSTVEVTLSPDGDGTRVRLVHRGITTREMREQHQQGWQHYLGRLAVAAAGGE